MVTIELAHHIFGLQNKYLYIERLCKDYYTDKAPEIVFSVTDADILFERQGEEKWLNDYLEALSFFRKITEYLLRYDIILFHSAALMMNGKAYLFSAPSGTGKSTHAALWKQHFGDRVTIINGDKPLLAVGKHEVTAYGTPYAGKERLQTNTCTPVAAIIQLKRGAKNSIRRMTDKEAYPFLLNQTYRCTDAAGLLHTMDLVKLLAEMPVFSLECTISEDAVSTVYNAVNNIKED